MVCNLSAKPEKKIILAEKGKKGWGVSWDEIKMLALIKIFFYIFWCPICFICIWHNLIN